jgi:hypothetical protein
MIINDVCQWAEHDRKTILNNPHADFVWSWTSVRVTGVNLNNSVEDRRVQISYSEAPTQLIYLDYFVGLTF